LCELIGRLATSEMFRSFRYFNATGRISVSPAERAG
jgi:hypothetical protein